MKVLYWPNPLLLQPTEPCIEAEDHSVIDLMHDLVRNKKAAGLAGVQVGIQRSFFIDEAKNVFYNPEFTPSPDGVLESVSEGCLSFPGIFVTVTRYDKIVAKWKDATWNDREETLTGFAAQLFQHETDHCHGKLFLELLDNGQLTNVKNQMYNLRKQGKLNA